MNDLDFDELDKAVNSLMTNVPQQLSGQSKNDETEHVLDIAPTLTRDITPTPDKLNEAITRVTTAPAPAARRGGRFMDVVHPSSDMKKASIPERPVTRVGVTIDPIRSVAMPTRADVTTKPAVSSTPFISNDNSQQAGEWPDPLEATDLGTVNLPEEEEWSAITALKDIESHDTSLLSPFLPDTKVEKRPLGNATLSMEQPEREADAVKLTVNDPNDQLPPTPPVVDQPLPEELQGDMMEVEADTHMGVPKTEESHPLEKSVAVRQELKAETPLLSAGPTSIPQQYYEEPSTGDKETGGIYDTSTYHQPLAHPAKKKSGWLWIVWIVLILLVGAGIGATLFFFDLI